MCENLSHQTRWRRDVNNPLRVLIDNSAGVSYNSVYLHLDNHTRIRIALRHYTCAFLVVLNKSNFKSERRVTTSGSESAPHQFSFSPLSCNTFAGKLFTVRHDEHVKAQGAHTNVLVLKNKRKTIVISCHHIL